MIDAGRRVAMTIREARTRAGLSQERAAALRGHATSTISRWENGSLPQTWAELHEYAKALHQPIVLRFGVPQTDETAPPEWARRLAIRLRAHSYRLEVTDEDLARAEAEMLAEETVAAAELEPPAPGGGDGVVAATA